MNLAVEWTYHKVHLLYSCCTTFHAEESHIVRVNAPATGLENARVLIRNLLSLFSLWRGLWLARGAVSVMRNPT